MRTTEQRQLGSGQSSTRDGHQSSSGAGRLAPGFFAPAEIAAYLGVSTYHVQELCRRGQLRHVKANRTIRIRLEWAEAYMAARERSPLE